MAATRARSTQSANGGPVVSKAKDVGESVATAGRKAKGPALTAGAAAAGLAGGLVLGARAASRRRGLRALVTPRPRILGVPIGRKSSAVRAAEALGQIARGVGSATSEVSTAGNEMRQIREQLDKANRQSPIEVVLDGLTHRRGAHKRES
ncbi:MAG TPA: hypothetical protein VGF25_13760 [Thermoleophilaceae bacterium]|jgi:hypothetical protein